MNSTPRVTKQDVEQNIVGVEFMLLPDNRSVLCFLTLQSGLVASSRATARRDEYFDEERGKYLAFIKAFEKAWEYTGLELHRQSDGNIVIHEYSPHSYPTKTYRCIEIKKQ